MYRPKGYLRIFSLEDDRIHEEDTVKCNHHQAIGFVQPGGLVLWPQLTDKQGRRLPPQEQYTCRLCYETICPRCADLPCRHFEKWLERVEAQGGALRLNLERMEETAFRAARAA